MMGQMEGLKTQEISGANRSGGNFDFEGKDGFSVKSKLRAHRIRITTNSTWKVNGFVVFSADYHGPKRHPPKHN